MQGFNFFSGNDPFKLADELEQKILNHPLPPMQEEIIVVQTKGLEKWFRLRFAKRNVICGGMKFLSPGAFMDLLGDSLSVSGTQESAFDPDHLKWAIFHILKTQSNAEEFKKVHNYINASELKAFKLSEKIADLFDQYLAYRPDMIDSWSLGTTVFENMDDELWQKVLWTELIHEFGENHELNRYRNLIEKLNLMIDLPFKRVSFFGASTLLPAHLHILKVLSEKREVNLFFFDPGAHDFWLDALNEKAKEAFLRKSFYGGHKADHFHLETGNELLNSWGMMGKDFLTALADIHFHQEIQCHSEKKPTTLLSQIQCDIFSNFNRTYVENNCPFRQSDSSLMVTSSHNQVREVEILYDYLLSCLDHDGLNNLRPDEILVMVPDIDAYASKIQAVFGNPARLPRIPYSIADVRQAKVASCSSNFLAIIDILTSRFSVPAIFSLLEFAPIRQKFNISEQDLGPVKAWLQESGIRWGIDGSHKQDYGLPAFNENTWSHGIDRMLMGYAVSERQLVNGIFPFSEIEGSSPAVLGNLLDFFHSLKTAFESVKTKAILPSWKERLLNLLGTFFQVTHETEQEMGYLERAISRLDEVYESCNFNEELPLEIIKAWITDHLKKDLKATGFISGGITFCSMIPMRAIPFRVICVLGLNDGDFPRKEVIPGFNLMKKGNRPLDRNLKKSDRYLFLEALLCAQDRLYLSFNGRSIKDNTKKQPSIMISELLDHIQRGFNIRDFIVEHPMTSSSQDYFSNNRDLFSYSTEDAEAATAGMYVQQETPDPDPRRLDSEGTTEIDLMDLLAFFKNPMKFFLTRAGGVSFKFEDQGIAEEELFDLNPLEKYLIHDNAIQKWKDKAMVAPDETYTQLNAQGRLPHGNMGRVIFQKTREEIGTLLETVDQVIAGEHERELSGILEFSIEKARIVLSGNVKNIFGSKRVHFRPSSDIKGKDVLELWINHLFINSLGPSIDSVFLVKTGKMFPLAAKAQTPAKLELEKLVRLFLRYKNQPMPFIPSISFEYASHLGPGALYKAENSWNNERNFDHSDIYFNICMDHFGIFSNEEGTESFKACSSLVFSFLREEAPQ